MKANESNFAFMSLLLFPEASRRGCVDALAGRGPYGRIFGCVCPPVKNWPK
jgi:hypothetical protein